MPNLPGTTPKLDDEMFTRVLKTDLYQLDQLKIYPCDVTPFTVIKNWHQDGSYVPYGDDHLVEIIANAKGQVPPWTRLNRIVRDIPMKYIKSGPQENLREVVLAYMSSKGKFCSCIRCREAGGLGGHMRDGYKKSKELTQKLTDDSPELVVRQYRASDGDEFFISFESKDRKTLFGFCRLRINDKETLENPSVFKSLQHSGLVRELHVYGQLVPTEAASTSSAQNSGFGRQLLAEAEAVSFDRKLLRMSVIAGVGSRGFYEKFGYSLLPTDPGMFMHKNLTQSSLITRGTISKRLHNHIPNTGYFTRVSGKSQQLVSVASVVVILLIISALVTQGYIIDPL